MFWMELLASQLILPLGIVIAWHGMYLESPANMP